jgi:hypothetical protein
MREFAEVLDDPERLSQLDQLIERATRLVRPKGE